MSATTIFIALIAASFYVLATVIMKLYGASLFYLALPVACLSLVAAAAFEIEILKNGNMARIFMIILSFEIILTLACAMLFTSDPLNWRDALGALLLFAGVYVMSGSGAVELNEAHAEAATMLALGEKQPRLGVIAGE